MAKNFKAARIEREQPVNSRARLAEDAVVPCFNYTGALKVGLSGFWPVTHPIELLHGMCTASGAGTTTAGLVILKHTLLINNLTSPPEVLKSFRLTSSQISLPFSMQRNMQPTTVAPGEVLYVASFANSNHQNIVIQLFGKKI